MIKPPSPPSDAPPFAVAILRDIVAWVQNLIRLPQPRKIYTIATLPSAADFAGATVPVSDGTGSKPTVTSNGSVWKYPDGTTA